MKIAGVRRSLQLGGSVLYIALCLAVALGSIRTRVDILAIATYLPVSLLYVLGIGLLIAGLKPKGVSFVIPALVGLSALFVSRPYTVLPHISSKHEESIGPLFTVMTYNVDSWNSDHDKLGRFLADSKAHVIFLQEVWWKSHLAEIAAHLPSYTYVQGGSSGDLAILSKFPVHQIEISPDAFPGLVAEAETPWGAVWLLNFRYRKGKKRWYIPALKETLALQMDDRKLIAGFLSQIDHPMIAGADLNAPPRSPCVRPLMRRFQDCFAEKGRGMGLTYPSIFPLWRIDYILTSSHFQVVQATVDDCNLSDHLPVVVVLRPLVSVKDPSIQAR